MTTTTEKPAPEVVDAQGAPAQDPPETTVSDEQWDEIIAVVRGEAQTAVGEAWAAHQPAVYAAMWAVMRDVAWVGKSGQMKGSAGTYAFRGIEDVQAALGQAFRAHGVMLSSTIPFAPSYDVREATKSDGKVTVTTTCRVVVEYRFTSLVDGSSVPMTAAGEGRDVFDKATSKAMTMALKYALTQATLLPTFDPDPDSQQVPGVPDDAPEVPRSPGPQDAGAPPADQPQEEPSPADVLVAIRGAGNLEDLDSIQAWLTDRDALALTEDGQAFSAHLSAARRALGGQG